MYKHKCFLNKKRDYKTYFGNLPFSFIRRENFTRVYYSKFFRVRESIEWVGGCMCMCLKRERKRVIVRT